MLASGSERMLEGWYNSSIANPAPIIPSFQYSIIPDHAWQKPQAKHSSNLQHIRCRLLGGTPHFNNLQTGEQWYRFCIMAMGQQDVY